MNLGTDVTAIRFQANLSGDHHGFFSAITTKEPLFAANCAGPHIIPQIEMGHGPVTC
jgi:hypothetical protein